MRSPSCSVLVVLSLLASCRCGEPEPRPDAGRRTSPPQEESATHLAASQIVVAYVGSRNAPARVTRTRSDAEAIARTLVEELRASPQRFAELARERSDSSTAAYGGTLGAWRKGTSRLSPELERALEKLAVGAISDPIDTAEGYTILLRQISVFAASQILIGYHTAARPVARVKRTLLEARALAADLATKVRAAPQNFGSWARKHSEDGGTRKYGGSLGTWLRGTRARLEATLDRMQIGEVSDPVATQQGFVILLRERPTPGLRPVRAAEKRP
jgi:parvulin-like peptidyl-prolyl isomerase